MKHKLLLILLCLIYLPAHGQGKFIINGVIIDSESGAPLAGTTVRIEATGFGAIADREGNFQIKSVPEGDYTLLVSLVGYKSEKIKLHIPHDDFSNLSIKLKVEPFKAQELVVSANKRIQSVQEVPISISIIEGKLLAQKNISKIDEALEYVPGVSLNGDHVSIRGSSGFAFGIGSRVALLLDGFPILSGDIGDMKFDAMPIFDIDRIEIVKGAGSALYGTSALGGVINIISRQPEESTKINYRTYGGVYTKPRFSSWVIDSDPRPIAGLDAGFAGKYGKLGVILSSGYVTDKSYTLYNNSYRWNIFSKVNFEASDKTTLSITGNFALEDRTDWVYWNSLDSATRPPATTNLWTRIYSDKLTIIGEVNHIFDDHNFMKFRSGIFRTNFMNTLPKNDPEHRSSLADSYNSELQANTRVSDELIMTHGLNYTYNDVVSLTYGNQSQHIISAYEQVEFTPLKEMTLNVGGRLDIEKTSGAERNLEFSPKFGLTYSSPLGIQFRASAGRGFRAASVAERYASVDFQGFKVLPNHDLKSESSWSFEVGGANSGILFDSPYSLDLAIFQNELYNLIEPGFTDNSYQQIMFKNVTRARIRGIEATLRLLPAGLFGLESGLTYMDSRDLVLNSILKYRPKFLWYSKVSFPLGPLEFQVDYRYISRIDQIDEELKFQVKDYDARVPVHVVDARFIINLGKMDIIPVTLTLNAKNLLDYYYVKMVGNLAPTRFIGLQLEGSL